MPGNSHVTGEQSIMFTDNCSFDGTKRAGKLATNGQIWMGSTAGNADAPNFTSRPVRVGTLESSDGSIDIVYSDILDTQGKIELSVAGGSTSVIALKTQDGNTVPPTSGVINVSGGIAVAGTTPVTTTGVIGTSTVTTAVQLTQTAAGADTTKVGLALFDSTDFTVSDGFVALAGAGAGQTITGDSGGALVPNSGNWNILGLSGSKTVGSGSTLTVKSPPYANQGSSTSVTLNSGSFATAAITLTTPVTAGLADGDLLEFVATNGVLVIQLAATQVAHVGSAASSAAGTITSTATGDSVSLRYQASTNDWWATSVIGVWVLA